MADDRTYRFRHSNVDLEQFVKGRRFAADRLRREAEVLLKRADQIEAEMYEWEAALEPVPLPAPPGGGE